jgi:transposase-like protein
MRSASSLAWSPPVSAFAGFRFPPEVIVVAIRWYLRFNLSYRDVEELLVERGVAVDHVTVFRWVQPFTPLLADAARFARHAPGERWFVDETYVKLNGVWRYVYRAVDQYGQVIDVLVAAHRDAAMARRFFRRALSTLKLTPVEVVTDAALSYPVVLEDLVPAARHHVQRHANNPIEPDHSQLKHRLTPMRGLRTDQTAAVIISGHAFMQNLRRGHYELALDVPSPERVAAMFTELALAGGLTRGSENEPPRPTTRQCNSAGLDVVRYQDRGSRSQRTGLPDRAHAGHHPPTWSGATNHADGRSRYVPAEGRSWSLTDHATYGIAQLKPMLVMLAGSAISKIAVKVVDCNAGIENPRRPSSC